MHFWGWGVGVGMGGIEKRLYKGVNIVLIYLIFTIWCVHLPLGKMFKDNTVKGIEITVN